MTQKNKKYRTIAGIDLGTTFSALATLDQIGKPQIIPNAEGERLTPSAVYFDEENHELIRVGVEAVNSRYLCPERSVRWIKRHMGQDDFHVDIDSRKWSPVDISALILKKLKNDSSLDDNNIDDVVISVPAHFDELRRKATMDAGKIAGLNVVGIVNEPVAAALYYATNCSVTGNVLVFDLGGGTFDVTIMNVKDQQMKILCSQGDHELGGIDFDSIILQIMQLKYKEQLNAELISSEQDRAKFEDEAEEIKKTLSRRDVSKSIIYGPAGSMKFELTRAEYEQAVDPLISRIRIMLEVALEEANLQPEKFRKVLLVGGSSRMPVVQQCLEKMFGFAPEIAVNVDECVALGAAIKAGMVAMDKDPKSIAPAIAQGLKNIKLTDVCNHSYGTICAPIDPKTGRRVILNKIILSKNTPLPCQISKMFYTVTQGQTNLEVTVTQGEDTTPEFVNTIATHKLTLPPDRSAECPVKVTYSYDADQRMHCAFQDVESGNAIEVDLRLNEKGKVCDSEIESKKQMVDAVEVK